MKKQAYNPFLPIDEHIPDGEPHVFGERVYLYGSHDKEAGESFCMLPYVVWSAPVNDLSDWSNKGVSYEATQDPLCSEERPHMYAPDCVRGSDGRYYLYYCLAGMYGRGGYDGPISVAVCDTPDGRFEYLGVVRNPDGSAWNDYVVFDPAVINDGGTIRLYFGTCYPFDNYPWLSQATVLWKMRAAMFNRPIEECRRKDSPMGAFTLTLDDDMLTVTGKAVRLFPTRTRGTQWAKHPFFEGSSIRKAGDRYYFVYSSQKNHELCYATSEYPDRDFVFGGTIVSNGDVGYCGRKEKDRLNHTGTTHGSIERIDGRWYVFYHRQTHGTDYSRQACAEPIEIMPDGSIPQVEITSCGLNGGALRPQGMFPAVICCNLTNGRMPHGGNKTFSGLPMVMSAQGKRFVRLTEGSMAVYKYFELSGRYRLTIRARGKGRLDVNGVVVETAGEDWNDYPCTVAGSGKAALTIKALSGNVELLSYEFTEG